MDTSSIPLFQLLTSRMTWLSSRQAVLSENVSNADTPNFVAHDLKPLDFQSLLKSDNSAGLAVTNSRHIKIGFHQAAGEAEEVPVSDSVDGVASGNAVSLEQEMIKLSDTQLQYQTATNIYQKAVAMFRTALGSGGGQP